MKELIGYVLARDLDNEEDVIFLGQNLIYFNKADARETLRHNPNWRLLEIKIESPQPNVESKDNPTTDASSS